MDVNFTFINQTASRATYLASQAGNRAQEVVVPPVAVNNDGQANVLGSVTIPVGGTYSISYNFLNVNNAVCNVLFTVANGPQNIEVLNQQAVNPPALLTNVVPQINRAANPVTAAVTISWQ